MKELVISTPQQVQNVGAGENGSQNVGFGVKLFTIFVSSIYPLPLLPSIGENCTATVWCINFFSQVFAWLRFSSFSPRYWVSYFFFFLSFFFNKSYFVVLLCTIDILELVKVKKCSCSIILWSQSRILKPTRLYYGSPVDPVALHLKDWLWNLVIYLIIICSSSSSIHLILMFFWKIF